MPAQTADEWEIDQDESGRPLVRHRHSDIAVTASVTNDADGIRSARCPECDQRYRLEPDD
jgi:hypothetical protein